jgi:ribonucleoside-diphosphate reductase alpha chain
MQKGNFSWLNDISIKFLERGYLPKGVQPLQRFRDIAEKAEAILGIDGYADKLYDYVGRGWYSFSSPILSNFAANRGLPISCFGSYIPDTMEGILTSVAEVGMMSKYGGGTSGYFGDVRPRGSSISVGGFSDGSVHFMGLFDKTIQVTKQSDVRRGAFAAYLPIDHGDIEEFLTIKGEGSTIQSILTGVVVSDEWMNSMISGDEQKREIWAKVLKSRNDRGIPYILFSDNINNNAPDVYKDKGLKIKASNLCTEIALSSTEDESFVCDLSSMNLRYYDEWKDTDAVEILTYLLDAVMTDFIDLSKDIPYFERANRFAKNQRALGIGVLGWHDLLQQKMIPFDSMEAMQLNAEVFSTIQEQSWEASKKLAKEYGEPPLLEGYGRRNVTLTAIAPTLSSSFIFGQTSQGIEPYTANAYNEELAKIDYQIKNRNLEKLLEEKGKNDTSTWRNIVRNNGSVQDLDFLSDHEKSVFKTYTETSHMAIVNQAAQRQRFIDQSQSLNFKLHPDTPVKDVNKLIIEAWEKGVKSLYYHKNENAARLLGSELLNCSACE